MKVRQSIIFLLFSAFFEGCSPDTKKHHDVKPHLSIENVRNKAAQALQYCQENNLNTDLCILIDMSVHSGKFRLHIYDFNMDSVIKSSLCSHGCGDEPWSSDVTKTSPVFSNTPNSHLSSLGKYRIGKRGYSNWGIHVNYRLHGLESANSNAFSRDIVLHSWENVADLETYPKGTPEGWGCPAVSDNTMRTLDSLLQNSGENVLLWIYN